MTPESADYLRKARAHLAKARDLFNITDYPEEAARAAYLAAVSAAQALIFVRDGRAAKTHRGVRISFARLAKDDVGIEQVHVDFLNDAYRFKEIADYGLDPQVVVSEADARDAIELAARLIDCITEILTRHHC